MKISPLFTLASRERLNVKNRWMAPIMGRETVVQHLYGELTFQEIATVRERPLGTVTSWYRRGLEKLQRDLEVTHGSV